VSLKARRNEAFQHPRVDVLGVKVSAIDMHYAIELADRWIATRASAYMCLTGVHGVMEAQSNCELRDTLNNALINGPDGMPMSWIGWLRGHRKMNRVYGPDFMAELCQLSVSRGYRHYLYGGKPGVAQLLKATLENRFPGLQIVGIFTPPFRTLDANEERNLIADVAGTAPDIVWVGLSTPKQELFMAAYLEKFSVPLLVGVGAAFDFHSGTIREAPNWMKRSGLQWSHRLMQDPTRLAERYLRNIPAFIWQIAKELLRRNGAAPHGEPSSSGQIRDNLQTHI
jgi:N-acetylglucosaminyldiphosphoundecaprenol N-acetyl-beta-D-mannosaminyltransferase